MQCPDCAGGMMFIAHCSVGPGRSNETYQCGNPDCATTTVVVETEP